MDGNIKIVIGSWGSYNECNERALGSKWLDLSDYKKILQCYAESNTKPDEKVMSFINKSWLPYANRKLRKIQKAAA